MIPREPQSCQAGGPLLFVCRDDLHFGKGLYMLYNQTKGFGEYSERSMFDWLELDLGIIIF